VLAQRSPGRRFVVMLCCAKSSTLEVVSVEQLEKIKTEREELKLEREKLDAEWNELREAKEQLRLDQRRLRVDREQLKQEFEHLDSERARMREENDGWGNNRDRNSLARALSKKKISSTSSVGGGSTGAAPKKRGLGRRVSIQLFGAPREREPSNRDSHVSWRDSGGSNESPESSPAAKPTAGRRGSLAWMRQQLSAPRSKSSPAM
jgi:cell division protein FtsL